jgi:AcrR family transcriptional regulator
MGKGDATRKAILTDAMALASTVGLEGLTIGRLAERLKLSKSGLFAHFRSKEKLAIEIIETARETFVEHVVAPALRAPRGEPRLRAFVERWMAWGQRPGGCIFVALAAELDDQPGPARDALAAAQHDWLDTLAGAGRIAVAEGHFRKDLDVQQLAFELYAVMLGFHHLQRFLRDAKAAARTRRAVDRLFESSR